MHKENFKPDIWIHDLNGRADLQIKNSNGKLIAEVSDNRSFSLEECYAHANLIAAAPEMYALLKYFYNQPQLPNLKRQLLKLLNKANGIEEKE